MRQVKRTTPFGSGRSLRSSSGIKPSSMADRLQVARWLLGRAGHLPPPRKPNSQVVTRLHEQPFSAAARTGTAIDKTATYVESQDFRGYDPYDALMSPLFRLPLLRSSHWVRLAAQQVLKRLPVNVRPLLGIRRHSSAVTVARMLEGYAHLFAIRPDRRDHYGQQVTVCLERIDELRS